MKLLKENKKENLPIDFITNFISQGWNEVGNLKASIEGINKSFKGTNNVEKILQDLVDAYLITIGQLELYLDKKNYVDFPDTQSEQDESLKEDLSKDAEEELAKLIIDEKEAVEGYEDTLNKLETKKEITPKAADVLKHINDEELEHIEELSKIVAGKEDEVSLNSDKEMVISEDDFFNSEFDEPDLDDGESDYKKWQAEHNNQ